MLSSQYIQLIKDGAFPQQIDPWAEQGEYFHQLHGHMITYLLDAIQDPLLALGYRVGREASTQIIERYLPDLFVEHRQSTPPYQSSYTQAAAQARLEFGIALESYSLELDRLHIKETTTGALVTVIELISPSNKTDYEKMLAYQHRREKLLAMHVHCVEIDLTRSVKRLLDAPIVAKYPYHVAVHLHDDVSRFIGIEQNASLKTFALPLRGEIVPVPLDEIYHRAYRQLVLADKILENNHYSEEHLPFPSLLSEEERKALLGQVETWKATLKEASR